MKEKIKFNVIGLRIITIDNEKKEMTGTIMKDKSNDPVLFEVESEEEYFKIKREYEKKLEKVLPEMKRLDKLVLKILPENKIINK